MLGFYSTASRTPARLRPGLFMLDGPSSRTPALPPRPSGTCFVRRAASRGYSPSVWQRAETASESLIYAASAAKPGAAFTHAANSAEAFGDKTITNRYVRSPLGFIRQFSARISITLRPPPGTFAKESCQDLSSSGVRVEVEGPLDLRRIYGNPPRMIAVSDQSKIYLSLRASLAGKAFYGEVPILRIPYVTGYELIKDNSGSQIGIDAAHQYAREQGWLIEAGKAFSVWMCLCIK